MGSRLFVFSGVLPRIADRAQQKVFGVACVRKLTCWPPAGARNSRFGHWSINAVLSRHSINFCFQISLSWNVLQSCKTWTCSWELDKTLNKKDVLLTKKLKEHPLQNNTCHLPNPMTKSWKRKVETDDLPLPCRTCPTSLSTPLEKPMTSLEIVTFPILLMMGFTTI